MSGCRRDPKDDMVVEVAMAARCINSAVAEKLAALMTEEYLRERGQRASASDFDAVLAKIPESPPVPGDEVPGGYQKPSRRRNEGSPQGQRSTVKGRSR